MDSTATEGVNLVTGATGIVGMQVVAQLLRDGQTVRALHRPSSDVARVTRFLEDEGLANEAATRLTWVEGDVTDGDTLEAALDGVGCVIHCAALVSFHPADHAAMRRINAQGTANLVNAMLHVGTPRMVHVSSVAALGRKAGRPTDETTLFEEHPGVTGYARSKHRAEMEVWRGAAEGISGGVVVVNPTIVLGPGDFTRSSGALFHQVHRGLAWYPQGSNGYVASWDVAEVCVKLARSSVRDARFVLCAEQWTYRNLMNAIADALECPRPTRPVRSWMPGLLWRFFWVVERWTGRRSVATKESLANTGAHHTYDGTKVLRTLHELGHTWAYTPIDEAVRRTARNFLAARAGAAKESGLGS